MELRNRGAILPRLFSPALDRGQDPASSIDGGVGPEFIRVFFSKRRCRPLEAGGNLLPAADPRLGACRRRPDAPGCDVRYTLAYSCIVDGERGAWAARLSAAVLQPDNCVPGRVRGLTGRGYGDIARRGNGPERVVGAR